MAVLGPVRYVIEELLSCLDLGKCRRLRIAYGDTPVGFLDAGIDMPMVRIPAHKPLDTIGAVDFDVVTHAGAPVPVVGKSDDAAIGRDTTAHVTFDLIATAFYFLTGRNLASGRLDRLGRARYAGSILASLRSAVPPVNALVTVLADAIRVGGGDVAPRIVPTLCVTGEGVVSERLSGHDWERERRIVRTTFVPARRGARAEVGKPGDELGLEATSDSPLDQQIARIVAVTGARPRGLRMRDRRFELEGLSAFVESVELDYDSSIGYPDAAEFPTGFTFPYRLFSTTLGRPRDVVEVPIYLAAETLLRETRASAEDLRAAVEHGANVVAQLGGALNVSLRPDLDGSAGAERDSLREAITNASALGLTSVSLSAAVDLRLEAYSAVRVEVVV
jgi:hypothetical protein